MRKKFDILRDVDERGGGSSIFDIFSMDFEGDQGGEVQEGPAVASAAPAEPSVPETSKEQESSTTSSAIDNSEVSQSTDEGSQVEQQNVPVDQNPVDQTPGPSFLRCPFGRGYEGDCKFNRKERRTKSRSS